MIKELDAFLEKEQGTLTEFLSRMIEADTTNPPGNEHRAVKVITSLLDERGIEYKTYEKEPGRTNLVAEVGSGAHPKLLVACHSDVVPAGEGWETDPFQPVVNDGRMYGRGTCDNKGQLASMTMLLMYLKSIEETLKGTFVFVMAADEERGSKLGMEYLMDEGFIDTDYAIIPDCADNMKTIVVTEKGVLWIELTSFGKQAHGSTPEKGINAIWSMVELLNRIKNVGSYLSTHPLHTPATFNLGQIEGGTAPNMVAGKCTAKIDIRYLPGQEAEDVMNYIREAVREVSSQIPGAKFDVKLIDSMPPTEVPVNNELVTVIQCNTEKILGFKPAVKGLSGATVTKQLISKGIIAVGFSPGDPYSAHVANESIEIQELVIFAKIIGRVAFDLLR